MDLDKMLGSGSVLSKGVGRVLVRAAVQAAVVWSRQGDSSALQERL